MCFVPLIFELFCLQNSLIVGMQPQVSGKVGSLVGWLVGFWVDHVRHSRRLSNFTVRLVVGAGTKMQMRTHGKFCYQSDTTKVSGFHSLDVGYLYIK